MRPIEPTVVEEAETLVNGPRRAEYGPAYLNFDRIARMWTGYLLDRKITPDSPVTRDDVCALMVLLKMARQAEGNRRDNIVDSIGYLRLIEMMREELRGERLRDGP